MIDGSSTMYPVTESVITIFRKDRESKQFVHTISGTRPGIERLCKGKVHIANASRSILQSELALCAENGIQVFEIPVAMDGVAVVVNASNDWVDHLSISELETIWKLDSEGVISNWSDVRPYWPEEPLFLYGPSSASGTHQFFFSTVLGSEEHARGDFVSSEDDTFLGKGIAENKYALGFFGLSYYKEDSFLFRLVPIDNEQDKNDARPVLPSKQTVLNNSYNPLARELYLYVNIDALSDKGIIEFLEYYLLHIERVSEDVGYFPKPQAVYASYLDSLQLYREQ
ncbi:MAG: phosphate ABC transporter substrate-binding protein PstS family protein, partial [Bacteroidota bacterium]